MAYIYHIITPDGTYVGQASGEYIKPQWPSMLLRGNLNECRLWWHFNNAYVMGSKKNWSKDEEDKRAEKEVATVLRKYSPGQVKVRVFHDINHYGIDEKAFKIFEKFWLPNGARVSQTSLNDVLSLINDINNKSFSSAQSKKNFINKKIKQRTLSDAEELDIAEIFHIYYLTKKNIKLLNTQMGGQTTGWFPISETKLGIDTSEKVLYREMSPKNACKTLDNYMHSTHDIVKQITNILNTTTEQVFTNQSFWGPVIDYIIDDPKMTLFQSIIDGKDRSTTVRELSKLVDGKIEPIKQQFVSIVNSQIVNILGPSNSNIVKLNIKDFFDDKNFGIINWDEILDWLTGYIYNILQDVITKTIVNIQSNLLKEYKRNIKTLGKKDAKKQYRVNLKEITSQVQSQFKLAQSGNISKWKQKDFYRNGVFKVGTMINLEKLNKVLSKKSYRETWQEHLNIDLNLGLIDQNLLKQYSMILFYDFYTNAVESAQNFSIEFVGYSGDRKKGDFVQYAKLDYGGNPEQFLNRKILRQYKKGGMQKSALIRQHWHQAFTSMFYLAEQKYSGETHIFIEDVEKKSKPEEGKDTQRVIHGYVYTTVPNPVYIVHDFPKNVWRMIRQSKVQSVNDLRYY